MEFPCQQLFGNDCFTAPCLPIQAQGLWNFAEEYMRGKEISPTFWNSSLRGRSGFKVRALGSPPEPSRAMISWTR